VSRRARSITAFHGSRHISYSSVRLDRIVVGSLAASRDKGFRVVRHYKNFELAPIHDGLLALEADGTLYVGTTAEESMPAADGEWL